MLFIAVEGALVDADHKAEAKAEAEAEAEDGARRDDLPFPGL